MYPEDRRYTKDHEWLRIVNGTAEVGITDFAQQQLGDVVYVDLPEVGRQIAAGQSFGSIESVKAVSELFAPVSGAIVEVNSALEANPEVVNSHPHDSWMIRVRLTNADEERSLLDSAEYQRLLAE